MARIRSIKPDFWKDGKVSRLTHSAALFFIGLWNFCDDEGKCRADLDTLANSMPVFTRREIPWHLSALLREGLISLSSEDHQEIISPLSLTHRGIIQGLSPHHHWIIVTSWHNQRISKPIHPQIKCMDLMDITPRVPQLKPDEYTGIGKDRIGEDRIGKELASDVKSLRRSPKSVKPDKPAKTSAVWDAYGEAYEGRFGNKPADNAVERKHLSRFIDLVGADIAPDIARFYLTHPSAYYLQKGYPTWLLAQDAQKLRTEYLSGVTITRQKAQDTERAYSNFEAFGLFGAEGASRG